MITNYTAALTLLDAIKCRRQPRLESASTVCACGMDGGDSGSSVLGLVIDTGQPAGAVHCARLLRVCGQPTAGGSSHVRRDRTGPGCEGADLARPRGHASGQPVSTSVGSGGPVQGCWKAWDKEFLPLSCSSVVGEGRALPSKVVVRIKCPGS